MIKALHILLLLLALPLQAAEPFSLQRLMQELGAADHPPRPFTELRRSELLVAPITLHGTLAFVDGRLIKHVEQPYDERYTIEEGQLLIERHDGGQQRIALAEQPSLQTFVTIFRASLQGDLETLQQHYQTWLSGDESSWQLRLLPRDATMAARLKAVYIEGGKAQIRRFIIEEQSGDSSTLEMGKRGR